VLETPPGRDCYGIVEVYADRLVVKGADTFASAEWVLGGGAVVGRVQQQGQQQGQQQSGHSVQAQAAQQQQQPREGTVSAA
jgi:hypothetical protein